MEEKQVKLIKDMEASQICLQNKLLTMEESHAKEKNAMKVEHSNQIDAIRIENTTLHDKLQMMKNSQVLIFQVRPKHKGFVTTHRSPSPPKHFPSRRKEVTFSIKDKSTLVKEDHAYVSPLTKYIQNKIGHTSDSLDLSSKHH